MKDRKIYCLNKISKKGTDCFRNGYELVENIDEAAGVLVRSADMHETVFPEKLRAIARAGAGYNNIPVDKAAEQGIVVFNTPGANANAVKELCLCGMLLASRDIVGGIDWVKANAEDPAVGRNAEKAKSQFAGNEIEGKSLGVIGLGAIGALVANAAVKLGMKVYGYDPYLSVNAAWQLSHSIIHAEKVEQIYENCDYITIHVPALPTTKGMLNKAAFDMMKDGTVILNFARDTLVNDDDMALALESGKIRHYVTDFANAKTANMKGAIVLPHLGASTEEAEENCAVMAARQMQDYLDNGNIRHSVNYPDIDEGVCKTAGRVAILHRNIPGMLSQFTTLFGEQHINIANLANRSNKDYAYTLIDIDDAFTDQSAEKLAAVEGVLRVRRIK